MDVQAMVDAMGKAGELTRSGYHLTLGDLIKTLEPHRGKGIMVPLGDPKSYRGYYSDLAFPRSESNLDEFLKVCVAAVGCTFEGYKGGDFTMREDTPLWVAEYGSCGDALMGISVVDGKVLLETKSVD